MTNNYKSKGRPQRIFAGWLRLMFVIALFFSGTITIQAQSTITTTLANNNGSSVVVFSFVNNNAFPVTINSIGSVAGATATYTCHLYAKSATYGVAPGAAGAVSIANGWTAVASNSSLALTANTTGSGSSATTFISGINYTVPALSQTRFCLQLATGAGLPAFTATAGSIRYSTVGTQTCLFSAGGCDVNTCTSYGYGGTLASPANSPRGFIGFITSTPAIACSGAPTAGTAIASVTSACPGSSFNLSLSGASVGTGLTYLWESADDAGFSVNLATVGTNAIQSLIQTSSKYYRCTITCTNSGLSAVSSTVFVSQNTFLNCYCPSSATSTADEEISNVTFATLNNSSNCATLAPGPGSVLNMYSNYKTSVTAPSVSKGTSYPISVTQTSCGGAFTNVIGAWIDWNQDGVFADPGERVLLSAAGIVGNQTATGTVTVPVTASTGQTVMRVVAVESSVVSPCGTYTWGETEDYLVDVQAPVTLDVALSTGAPSGAVLCTNPNNVTVSLLNAGTDPLDLSVTPVTINLTITGAGSGSFSTTLNSGIVAPLASLPVTITSAFNFSLNGTYNFSATASAPGEVPSSNNTTTWTASPVISTTASATPNPACIGGTVQLNAANTIFTYGVSSIPYAPDASALTQSGAALGDEGNIDVTLPFTFTFNGVPYTGVTIHSNGQILMGTGNTTANAVYSPPTIFSNTAPNNWVGFWSDLNVSVAGSITYDVIGSAPSRKLVVRFTNVDFWSATPFVSYQIELNETTNIIDVFLTSVNGVTNTKAIGLETSTGGIAPPGRNSGTWTASNEGWRFAPTGAIYSWSPATGLSSTTIQNPVASGLPAGSQTYTVTVTDANSGCSSASSVVVVTQDLPVAPINLTASSGCGNFNAALTATAVGGGTIRWYTVATGGSIVATGSSVSIPVSTTTDFYAAEVNGAGCEGPRSLVTAVSTAPPAVSIAITPNDSICLGQSATINVTSSNPTYVYTWTQPLNGGLNTTSGPTVIATPTVQGSYSYILTATDGGCVRIDSAVVAVANYPVITVSTTKSVMCEGDFATLNVSSPVAAPTYCAVTNAGGSCITNVSIANINRTSACDVIGTYYINTGVNGTVYPGTTYPLSVTCDGGAIISVWIDYNRDGVFDASEWQQVTISSTANVPTVINVTIPSGATLGRTGMRIRSRLTGNINGATDACLNMGSGETEDYTLDIGGPPVGLTYVWSPSSYLSSATSASPVFSGAPVGSYSYTVVASNAYGCTSTSTPINLTVNDAPDAPVCAGDVVCGQGTVTLTATGGPGTLIWTKDGQGGSIIGTGNSVSFFTAASGNGYVREVPATAVTASAGYNPVTTPDFAIGYFSASTQGMWFRSLSGNGFILNSVDIISNSAVGTPYSIAVQDTFGNNIAVVSGLTTVTNTSTSYPFNIQTVNMNVYIPYSPNMYKLVPVQNPNLAVFQSTVVQGTYASWTIADQMQIVGYGNTGAVPSIFTNTTFGFFLNWNVTTGCIGPACVAPFTVTTPPDLEIIPVGPTSYCNTGSVILDALALSDPSWVNFNWTPATGLNTATGPFVIASPTVTTTYLLTADDGTPGGCVDTTSITITVNTGPTVSIDPAPYDSLCSGSSFQVNATAGSSSFKSIGTGHNAANNTIAVYDGSNSNVKTQILYTAAELNAAGLIGPGNITSISFEVANKLSTGSLNGFSISIAPTASVAPLTATYVTGTFTNVYSGTVTTALGWNQHLFTTPFFWDGVSNIVVEICNGVPTVPGFDQVYSTLTASAQTIQANLLGVVLQQLVILSYNVRMHDLPVVMYCTPGHLQVN